MSAESEPREIPRPELQAQLEPTGAPREPAPVSQKQPPLAPVMTPVGIRAPAAAPRPIASALRSALLRWALLSVVFFTTLVTIFLGGAILFRHSMRLEEVLAFAITTLVLGAVGAPLAFVESFFARRSRTTPGDWTAGGLVLLLAYAGFFVASIQIAYTYAAIKSGSIETGAAGVQRWFTQIAREPKVLTVFLLPASAFPTTTVARLRGCSLPRTMVVAALGGAVFSFPTLAVIVHDRNMLDDEKDNTEFVLACLVFVAGYALVPVALHVADSIERRIGAWLRRRDLATL